MLDVMSGNCVSMKLGTFSQWFDTLHKTFTCSLLLPLSFLLVKLDVIVQHRGQVFDRLQPPAVSEIKNKFGEMRLQDSITSRVIWQGKRLSLLQSVKTGCGTHPVHYSKGTIGILPGGTEVAGLLSCTSPPPLPNQCFLGVHRSNFPRTSCRSEFCLCHE